jgi:hypothetical protein
VQVVGFMMTTNEKNVKSFHFNIRNGCIPENVQVVVVNFFFTTPDPFHGMEFFAH